LAIYFIPPGGQRPMSLTKKYQENVADIPFQTAVMQKGYGKY